VFRSRIIRHFEGRIAHSTSQDRPEGFGQIHPALAWEEWISWQWHLGVVVDRCISLIHRIPGAQPTICLWWCDHHQMERGLWAPIRSVFIPIAWDKSPRGEEIAGRRA
jgi:hypothetical protein